ncbi:MAG TPA: hypothetical protein VL171_17080 [Verrucomicrobiae bacterium]|nr:hypothetical protein [Verrucomicrobiae bacterium]
MNGNLRTQLNRTQWSAFVIGGLALIACIIGGALNPTGFFQGYLMAYMFWLGVSLGCMAILMIHYLAGGRWGFAVRRLLEAATRTLPVMLVLFIPYLFGLGKLYVWTQPQMVARDALLQHKHPYLNVPFFIGRAAIYFAVWLGAAFLLNRASHEQDRNPGITTPATARVASSFGVILYVVTMSFAGIDWVMSLEPHWFSTMYGLLILAGQVVCGYAFVIIVAALLADTPPLSEVIEPLHFHDLGNFLLTFIIFWAYISFSQFLIIWSGNLTDENPWYLRRFEHGWQWIGVSLVAFHFFVPFFLLLSRDIKRRSPWLAKVAGIVFVMCVVDLFWIIAPGFHRVELSVHWMDVVALIGLGGIWIGFYVHQLKRKLLVPLYDARTQESRLSS